MQFFLHPRKLIIIGLFLVGSVIQSLGQGRIRLDMTFVGNDQEQEVYLKDMQWDKSVSIPKTQYVSDFEYGEYQIEVVDSLSQALLFKQGFSSLFYEWRTTQQAKEQDGGYDQSIFIPAFSQAILVRILERKKDLGKYFELAQWQLNTTKRQILLQPNTFYQHKKIVDNGDSDKKVDLVFLAEGYTEQQKEKFHLDVNRMITELFKTEPYATQKSSFNVWLVESFSKESGPSIPHKGIYKNTAFSSSFNALQIERYLMINNQTEVIKAVAGIPCDAVYVLVNTDQYGGGGIYNFYGMSASDCRVASIIFVHEFGHSFAGLADEYYESATTYTDFYSKLTEPWEPNITNFIRFDTKWQNMLKANTPIPTAVEDAHKYPLGAYEGAAYMSKEMFRPAVNCRMKTNEAAGFCPVCNRSISRMIQFYCK